MSNIIFLSCLSIALSLFYFWAFRSFPGEHWQFLAALPRKRNSDGTWNAKNLTWYGALTAFAFTTAIMLFYVLGKASGIATIPLALFLIAHLALTIPAAKITAYVIEKRRGTMTIGGAVFVGLIAAPWIISGIEAVLNLPPGRLSPLLSAMVISYALGEGIGRLACLSFGCCFGKRIDNTGKLTRFLFGGVPLVFRGSTKKVSYEGNLEGEKLVPIQAITAVSYSAVALISTWVFLRGRFPEAFLIAASATLIWRPISELFRADYRGGGKFSSYQLMSAFGAVYSIALYFILPFPESSGMDIIDGLFALADWRILLFLEISFIGLFIYSGLSTVTDSRIEFSVKPEFLRPGRSPFHGTEEKGTKETA